MECIILMGVGIVIGIYIATQIERGISMRINNNKLLKNLKDYEIQEYKKDTKKSNK